MVSDACVEEHRFLSLVNIFTGTVLSCQAKMFRNHYRFSREILFWYNKQDCRPEDNQTVAGMIG